MIRTLALALALAGLLAGWGVATARGRVGYLALVDAPDGTVSTLSLFTVHEIRPPDHYTVRRGDLRFEVHGPTAGLSPGMDLTVRGVFEDRVLDESWRALAPDRGRKRGLGLLGLALAGGMGFVAVGGTASGLHLRG